MIIPPFSINPRGEWSPNQAQAVLQEIEQEALARGLRFVIIDITTYGGPQRVILVPRCIRHDEPIPQDSICPKCLEESS